MELKSPTEIGLMRRAGASVARTLALVEQLVGPGITTGELNDRAETLIRQEGGVPAFLGYHGYPKAICVSIDDEVVHGIPGSRRLKSGQIVSVDVGVALDGYFADGAATFAVGRVSDEAARLLAVTQKALAAGIAQAKAGNRLSDISAAVQGTVEENGFSVVRDLVGHGIGRQMHEEPQVPNFGRPGEGPTLAVGLVLAIEPMVNAGGYAVAVKPDRWTVVTKDGSLSAHFEHTVAITDNGPEILTWFGELTTLSKVAGR